jgi:hypothetical protein
LESDAIFPAPKAWTFEEKQKNTKRNKGRFEKEGPMATRFLDRAWAVQMA